MCHRKQKRTGAQSHGREHLILLAALLEIEMYITMSSALTQFARDMNLMYELNLSIATESTLYGYIESARNGAITASASES